MAHLMGVDRSLHLLQCAFAHAYRDAVLFAFDRREHFRLAGIQLGALQGVLGGHLAHGVGFVVHLLSGLGLHDVAIHRLHVGAADQDVLLLLDAVELHHHVALLRPGGRLAARWTMRRPGTCGAFRMVERALLMSPRVRTLIMKSPRRARATGDFHFGGAGVAVCGETAAREQQQDRRSR